MSRKRYISTDISSDAKINRLATEHGDFAVLLYTWMIPHAEADGSIRGEPEEIMLRIIPGRRDKTVEDVERALRGMEAVGLITWQADQRLLHIDLDYWAPRRTDTGRHRTWRKQILERDNHTCQRCGETCHPLHAHHIKTWAAYPDERYDLNNGVTLCQNCHRAIHSGEDDDGS